MSAFPQIGSDIFNANLEAQGYSGEAVKAAENMVYQVLQEMGFPTTGINIEAAVNHALVHHLYTEGRAGWHSLVTSGYFPDAGKVAPWAMWGMTSDQYHQQVATLQSSYLDLTGKDMDAGLLDQALMNGWTPAMIAQQVESGASPTGTGPWLSEGVSFTKAREDYISTYGEAPKDTEALSSWYKFRRGARQIGGGAEAKVGDAAPKQQNPGDSEVR